MNPDDDEATMDPRVYNRSLKAWGWAAWRVRMRYPYNKTPQHRWKRGLRLRLSRVLDHMRAGTTTDLEAAWMHQYVTDLQRQADIHRKDNELMLRVTNADRQRLWDLRDENARMKEENARLRQHLNLRPRPDDHDWLRDSVLRTRLGDRGETVTGD